MAQRTLDETTVYRLRALDAEAAHAKTEVEMWIGRAAQAQERRNRAFAAAGLVDGDDGLTFVPDGPKMGLVVRTKDRQPAEFTPAPEQGTTEPAQEKN